MFALGAVLGLLGGMGKIGTAFSASSDANNMRQNRFGNVRKEVSDVYGDMFKQQSQSGRDNTLQNMYTMAGSGSGSDASKASGMRAAQQALPQVAAASDMQASNAAQGFTNSVMGAKAQQGAMDAMDSQNIWGNMEKGWQGIADMGAGGMSGAMLSDEREKVPVQAASESAAQVPGYRTGDIQAGEAMPTKWASRQKSGGEWRDYLPDTMREAPVVEDRIVRAPKPQQEVSDLESLRSFVEGVIKQSRASGDSAMAQKRAAGSREDAFAALPEEEKAKRRQEREWERTRRLTLPEQEQRRLELMDDAHRVYGDVTPDIAEEINQFVSPPDPRSMGAPPAPGEEPVGWRMVGGRMVPTSDPLAPEVPPKESEDGDFKELMDATRALIKKPVPMPDVRSDERAKVMGREMVRKAPGQPYVYVNPKAQGAAPGVQYGPTAQGIARSQAGRQAVKQAPDGKLMVDPARVAMASVGALHDLDDRLRRLEAM